MLRRRDTAQERRNDRTPGQAAFTPDKEAGHDMTETRQSHRAAGNAPAQDSAPVTRTAWLGWIYFAGLMMIMLGFFQAITGLVAIFDDGYYLVADEGLVVSVDYTLWGVLHLTLGIVAFAAGYAVLRGQTWGRVIGIILAVGSAVVNMAFIAAYPIWAIIIIAVDVVIIYALAVHGREARDYL
jgi:hypothetical protein